MIEENMPLSRLGLPDGLQQLDAAFVWGKNKKTYFFRLKLTQHSLTKTTQLNFFANCIIKQKPVLALWRRSKKDGCWLSSWSLQMERSAYRFGCCNAMDRRYMSFVLHVIQTELWYKYFQNFRKDLFFQKQTFLALWWRHHPHRDPLPFNCRTILAWMPRIVL